MSASDDDEIEITPEMLQGAKDGIQALMRGESVDGGDNPLLAGLMESLEDDSLPGYHRGRELTEAEVRQLAVGDVVWVRWCKDDRPTDCRFDGAYRVEAIDSEGFEVSDGEHWYFHGDTGRGQAHYYEAVKA